MTGKSIAAGLIAMAMAPLVSGCQAEAPAADPRDSAAVDAPVLPPDGEFPAAFRGRWGVSPSDCTPAGGGSEMFVEVQATRLRMTDRSANVKALTVEKPTQLVADLAFSGQGLEWPRQSRFYLEDDGRTLVRSDQNPIVNFTYTRCPD